MLALVKSVVEYTRSSMSNSSHEKSVANRDIQFTNLANHMKGLTPDYPDATAAQSYLRDHAVSVFTPAQTEQLASVIDQVVTSSTARNVCGKTQSCPNFYNYLTEARWSAILADSVSVTAVLQYLVTDMLELGLVWPNECTQATVVSIALKRDPDITPHQFYARMEEVKSLLVSSRAVGNISRRAVVGPKLYPPTGDELKMAYPAAYAQADPPVMSRYPAVELVAYRNKHPWRNTSKSLRTDAGIRHQRAPRAHAVPSLQTGDAPVNLMEQAGAFMLNMLMGQGAQLGGVKCPMLRIDSTRTPATEGDTGPTPMLANGSMLAIADRAEAAAAAPEASGVAPPRKRPSLDDQSQPYFLCVIVFLLFILLLYIYLRRILSFFSLP